jgi:hypothetical protein
MYTDVNSCSLWCCLSIIRRRWNILLESVQSRNTFVYCCLSAASMCELADVTYMFLVEVRQHFLHVNIGTSEHMRLQNTKVSSYINPCFYLRNIVMNSSFRNVCNCYAIHSTHGWTLLIKYRAEIASEIIFLNGLMGSNCLTRMRNELGEEN